MPDRGGAHRTAVSIGVAIGSFQALKHRAANMFCEIELSKSCVLEALTALDEGRDVEEVVAEWMANNPTVWQPWVAASK